MNLVRRTAAQLFRQPSKRHATGFEAAGTGRRGAGWTATRLGLNTLLFASGETLLARSRDAARNTPWAASAIDSWVANAIGRGIRMVPQHPNPDVRKVITRAWNRWTKQSDIEFEPSNPASGQTDFYGQQVIGAREMIEGGEVFVHLRFRPSSDGLAVPLQLQLIEAEQLPIYRNSPGVVIPDGNIVRMGIEYRPDGRREAYHFYKAHPYETIFYPLDGLQVNRLKATEVLHCYKPIRAGQMRGQPWMASVLTTLYEIDQYHDAEIVRKKVTSMISGFITKTTAEAKILQEGALPGGTGPADALAAVTNLEPGTWQVLFPGEDVKFAEPKSDMDFEPFVRVALRAFATGAGITYEQATGDLSKVNFSSIRAGLLEFRRKCEQFQRLVFVFQFCDPIYRIWLRTAVISGALRLPGYASNPEPYEDVRWETPGWSWVNPKDDFEASRDSIRAGLSTRSIELASRGLDPEAVDAEIAADRERADKYGNVYDSDPNKVLLGKETDNGDEVMPKRRRE